MRMDRRRIIAADRADIWRHVSDPDCYPEFMASLERWEPLSDKPVEVGSRFTVHWKVGSVPIGGIIEVSEFDEGRDLAWIGITGVTMRGRFRMRDHGDGPDRKTKVNFRMSYEAPGGLLGLIADRVASRQVGRIMDETLKRLERLVTV
jgi:uncharacterized membrane protein